MASTILDTLEFNRVLEMLERHCAFSLASERAFQLGPSSDPDTVSYLLEVSRQAFNLVETRPSFGVGGARDIREQVGRAALGSILSPHDLLLVLDTVSSARTLRRNFRKIETGGQDYPAFEEFVGHVADLPNLEADLKRAIGDNGEILDGASDELRRIRQQLRTAHARVVERIRRYLTSSDTSAALQEQIVTSRDGRYVVPVRADRRSQLKGVVHDTSASGQTLFVEPLEVVELNNRWRELQSAERHEIERILTILTEAVAREKDALQQTLDAMAAIDLALAKARLAVSENLSLPLLVKGNRQRIVMQRARHPLLDRATVVPIDVELGVDYRVLVITGPNTGGKTVALKTVGLCVLMAQSGLYIPADPGSELSVFDGVFADIGDEQSIEQSLSTFSSHMTRVIATLRSITPDSLVLFDELGAGTDPEEGAALARALITELLEIGCLSITTTHYSELKSFAYMTPEVENGSVEFDLATLSPTYRLIVGVPGRSNALAIARRLGLPDRVLERAREYVDPATEHVDALLAEIVDRRNATEAARAEAEQARIEARGALEDAQRQRAAAQREALVEIEDELSDARATLRRLKRLPDEAPISQVKKQAETSRQELEQATQQVRRTAKRRTQNVTTRQPVKVGDTVSLIALGGEGEVVGFSEDGLEADVQMGPFKVRQPLDDLRRKKPSPEQARRRTPVSAPQPRRRVDMELNLRGQRAAGIDEELDEYLNDAYLGHIPWVRIIHGKGTGALREVVRQFLSGHPLVAKFETPPQNEGGDGVTIAYLREG
ncbi:MAG: endonuclease MutS2 [Chloroflexia bacterium]|nr:endonuclease MutS2 [Chloroflexia bacterium]